MKSAVLRNAWFAVLAISTGLVLALLQLAAQQSHLDAYEKVQLGMARADVLQTLQGDGVLCGDGYRMCSFADPWRQYHISFNPETGLVNMKFFVFKRQIFLPLP